jgi:exonuclease III
MRSVLQRSFLAGVLALNLCGPSLSAQTDTIRIMNYNMLFYGSGTSTNAYAYKDPRLQTIVQYVQPDILAANEIGSDSLHLAHLDTVLGGGWSHGSYINTNNQTQTNNLFWKTSKFGLKSELSICSDLRDIIAYKLYFKDTVTVLHDTVYITIINAHMKAGQANQDAADRAAEAHAVRTYLNSLGAQGNYMFVGDFNVYSSNDSAYQVLVNSNNPFSKLYDPINQPGNWSANDTFAMLHTQSTRDTAMGGGVGSGLDDRFDQQLVSGYIMNFTKGVKYLPGSYKAVGQDGLHFDTSLVALPVNTSAPSNVITALYEMSDHLPVQADYIFKAVNPASAASVNNIAYNTSVVNPIQNNQLSILFDERLNGEEVNIELYSIDGSKQFSGTVTIDKSSLFRSFELNQMSGGVYFLRINGGHGYSYFAKVVNY